jgi:hypothetical protein
MSHSVSFALAIPLPNSSSYLDLGHHHRTRSLPHALVSMPESTPKATTTLIDGTWFWTSCKWNHTVCLSACTASFIQCQGFEIHLCLCRFEWLVFPCGWAVRLFTTDCSHVCCFLPEVRQVLSLDTCFYSSLGEYTGVKLPGSRVGVCLALQEHARAFSKGLYHFTLSQLQGLSPAALLIFSDVRLSAILAGMWWHLMVMLVYFPVTAVICVFLKFVQQFRVPDSSPVCLKVLWVFSPPHFLFVDAFARHCGSRL